MNYRHAFHAGGFSDVVKHALLTRLVLYLQRKPKPVRIFDTHAGLARYSLAGDAALRTGEAEAGVRKLASAPAAQAEPMLAPYWSTIAADLHADRYPGSSTLIRRLMRPVDRLSSYELHPEDTAALKAAFEGDVQVKTIALDARLALGSHLPPKERRGLVFIDPAYEVPDEADRIVKALGKAFHRWPTGVYALWYPVKHRGAMDRMLARIAAIAPGETVATEFAVEPEARRDGDPRLVGSGLAVVNPPFVFGSEAEAVFRGLAPVLGRGVDATWRVFTPDPAEAKS